MKKAIILLSGGIDSATILALVQQQGFDCYALTIDYNQRHRIEIEYAKKIAQASGVKEHRIFNLDISQWGGSALTDKTLNVPHQIKDDVPVTYVPARNTLFLSIACSWAESLGVSDVFFGSNKDDHLNYPDCRPEFFHAYETMINLATREGVEGRPIRIHTPLLHFTKAEVVRCGESLGLNYTKTFSCYDPIDSIACQKCLACIIREKALKQ